ncbi:MAG: hypothetical protein KatS3mg030_315 [Saprospiraceae bacterium]|nr:MAG: hypothetical protein KatS3mg030_315 [Saprospiraceae bacterium]
MATKYTDNLRKLFRNYKSLSERAMAQLDNSQMHWRRDEHSNNVATIAKHMAGNLISRFTNFMTEDGEKPWRNRESEFDDDFSSREQLMDYWEKGWQCLFDAIEPLTDEDLDRTVKIRNEPHTVLEALNRQLTHYAYHAGQIVLLAKMQKGAEFESLSIPRGQSEEFNARMFS